LKDELKRLKDEGKSFERESELEGLLEKERKNHEADIGAYEKKLT
jgi:hypothetical protein